jgi:hypothetical protein
MKMLMIELEEILFFQNTKIDHCFNFCSIMSFLFSRKISFLYLFFSFFSVLYSSSSCSVLLFVCLFVVVFFVIYTKILRAIYTLK